MVGVFSQQGFDLCIKLWLNRLEKVTIANGILGVCTDWSDTRPAPLRLWVPNVEESKTKERDSSCIKDCCNQNNED